MGDEKNEGTLPEGTEAQPAAAAAVGTPAQPDEVTTLKSRNAGLDAKVTSLSETLKAATARAEAAEKRALELAEGKENGDAELRAQVERMKAENAQAALDAKLARVEAKYPETFGVFGAASAGMTDEQLAASEARMAGVAGEVESPTPLGANPARGQAARPKAVEDMSVKELEAHLRAFDPSVMTSAR